MIAVSNRAHIYVRPDVKEQLKSCFTTVLGCEPAVSLDNPGQADPILAFRFPNGGSLSFEFTEDAPDEQQARRGAWLEVKANDPSALKERIRKAGLPQLKHPATSTFYFVVPGGQVVGIV